MNKTSRKLNKMTEQEVFDTVARHLLTQKEQCLIRGSFKDCAYRTEYENGTVLYCAAGCLIEDEDYNIALEGKAWDDLVYAGIMPDTHMRLIQKLQSIHDEESISSWRFSLMNLAIDFKLNPKVLHEL